MASSSSKTPSNNELSAAWTPGIQQKYGLAKKAFYALLEKKLPQGETGKLEAVKEYFNRYEDSGRQKWENVLHTDRMIKKEVDTTEGISIISLPLYKFNKKSQKNQS